MKDPVVVVVAAVVCCEEVVTRMKSSRVQHSTRSLWRNVMRFKRSDCGGGQVVSVFAFYSNDPSSNPAEAYSFSVKFSFEKNKNKQKESRVGPFL